MTRKNKITPVTSPLFCNRTSDYLVKRTLLLISTLWFIDVNGP